MQGQDWLDLKELKLEKEKEQGERARACTRGCLGAPAYTGRKLSLRAALTLDRHPPTKGVPGSGPQAASERRPGRPVRKALLPEHLASAGVRGGASLCPRG